MVLTENGSLQSSYQEYDKRVVGIVSGASGYKPGIILDRQEQEQKNKNRLPISLMGKVYCKVDARYSSIEIGDLLTTSSTKCYAMKAEESLEGFWSSDWKGIRFNKRRDRNDTCISYITIETFFSKCSRDTQKMGASFKNDVWQWFIGINFVLSFIP